VRVLLVDDEPLQRLLLMRALEPLGVEVSEPRNGREALDLFKEKPYHLVFTDLHMPLMDGLELTRAIKAQDPLLPVIPFYANAFVLGHQWNRVCRLRVSGSWARTRHRSATTSIISSRS
jgi:CheY-like chemotaxis protein